MGGTAWRSAHDAIHARSQGGEQVGQIRLPRGGGTGKMTASLRPHLAQVTPRMGASSCARLGWDAIELTLDAEPTRVPL